MYKRLFAIYNTDELIEFISSKPNIKIRPARTGEPNCYAIEGPDNEKRFIDNVVKRFDATAADNISTKGEYHV